jgi:hypothetical protein
MNQLELPDPQLDPDDDGMLRMSILEHLKNCARASSAR